ncbi:hypothetical protein [Rhodoferax ferrireducens]|uniref:hypothetical protein n=1 Tax=Rhodoferax ferrireducens TaxID=192843 RepID=UPI000E0D9A1B|nr:hypothetical protein [Rhodoferax ferrireducens]
MPTDPLPESDPQIQRLHHMESSFEALNARIARLAIGLGVSLKSDDEVVRVMSRHQVVRVSQERRVTLDRRGASRTDSSSERRVAHLWEELRGLLVLRYGVETRYVDEVGVSATRRILVEAEAHLTRAGFKPGADGINLDRLFNES